MPGYHFIILPNGIPVQLLPIDEVSNGVKGFNKHRLFGRSDAKTIL
jgi:N-acetylmuramoyl-L-alanine amidase